MGWIGARHGPIPALFGNRNLLGFLPSQDVEKVTLTRFRERQASGIHRLVTTPKRFAKS